DFRKLRSSRSESNLGEGRWRAANDSLFGRALSPIVVMAQSPEQAIQAGHVIEATDRALPGPSLVGHVVTMADVVPGSPAEQQAKLGLLADIRALARDPSFELLDSDERAALERHLPPAGLTPITPSDIPPLLRRPLLLRDGSFGNVALVLPQA